MKNKYTKLLISIFLDVIGVLPYFIPAIGEITDVIWAPLSAYLIGRVYQNKISKYTAIFGFLEEAFPFTDVFPTFTFTWVLSMLFDKKR